MKAESILDELRQYLETQLLAKSRPAAPPPVSLAAALFSRQLALNPAAARYLNSTGRIPADIRALTDLPAVPVAAFKEMELTTIPPAHRITEFHSSGTTGQSFSRHLHSAATLQIYRLAIAAWFERRLLGDLVEKGPGQKITMLSLTPSPKDAPHSSLAFMIDSLFARYGSAASSFAGQVSPDGWHLDAPGAREALRRAEAGSAPVVLSGTAFNFVHLLDALAKSGERFTLPDGSRVMETGGYKGRSRAIPREELHASIGERMGIAPDRVASEYGMCELSSQAYDVDCLVQPTAARLAPRRFQFPPWCATTVISPETGRPATLGEPGLLRIVDLANVASVLAIQTEDLAVQHTDGIELLGRAPGAEARGCSLLPS